MSVDLVYLLPVPKALVGSDDFLDVEDGWKGQDWVILFGDRWNPRWFTDAEARRKLAFELSKEHLAILRKLRPPREILAVPDAGCPSARATTYAGMRKIWERAGAVVLPDVVDALATGVRPLEPKDVRLPFPEGTRRARLRRLDAEFALTQISGRPYGAKRAVGYRAGMVLVDVESDLETLRRFYLTEMKNLGLKTRDERAGRFVEQTYVQLRGSAEGLHVSVGIQPEAGGVFGVSILWADRPAPTSSAPGSAKGEPSSKTPQRTRSSRPRSRKRSAPRRGT